MSQAMTKCPKCGTTFRVSDAQLQVAKGKVRCGSCLNVFKAADHWVNQPAVPAATAAKPAPAPAAKKAEATKPVMKPAVGKFQFDQAAIDGGSADKVLTKPVQPAVNTQGEIKAAPAPSKPKRVEPEDDDTKLILDEEDEEVRITDTDTEGQVGNEEDYADLFVNLDDLEEGTGDQFNTQTDFEALDEPLPGGKNKAVAAADESWAKDLIDDSAEQEKQKQDQVKKLLSAGIKDNVFADDGHVKKKDDTARDGFVSGNRVDPLADLGLNKPEPPKPALNRKAIVSKIEPAPVDMDWMPAPSRDWLGIALWSSLNLLAALCLVFQYFWVNFQTLSREHSYRPMYASACHVLGCNLPDMFNPDAIRVVQVMPRLDPQQPGIITVDAIIQNDASYDQPFPEIELYFADLDNFPVASRRFTPAEYLQGEMAGKTVMPSAKSVHFALKIVDPGSKAPNYRLQISNRKPVNS